MTFRLVVHRLPLPNCACALRSWIFIPFSFALTIYHRDLWLYLGELRSVAQSETLFFFEGGGGGFITVKVLITAPKHLILIFSWRFYWSQKTLLKSLVALKLGWRLVNRTLHTKAQRFLFSKRRFKKFSTAVGAINRAQQSSLISKWRLN